MMFFYPMKDTPKFCVDILIRSVSGRGGQEGQYLEDIKGSDWRQGGLDIGRIPKITI